MTSRNRRPTGGRHPGPPIAASSATGRTSGAGLSNPLGALGAQDPENSTRFMLLGVCAGQDELAEFESGREYMQDYFARAEERWAQPRDLTTREPVA